MCQLDNIGTALEGLPECDSAHGLEFREHALKKDWKATRARQPDCGSDPDLLLVLDAKPGKLTPAKSG